ncbi:hypothetical protein ATANTOWER_016986 [Ataeniobius toweri]|uniref:Uncharacterized protein n=1 Tax=Ataeniobius toweri TaxID=208326 RepID=A0ABU7A6V0_9TELE|nr:hypothetical protein [Ataeniobius toweri]
MLGHISLRIRLLLLGQSQVHAASRDIKGSLSECVSRDERRYKHSSVECDQQGSRCTLRTTLCCVSRQGSQAALTRQPYTGDEMHYKGALDKEAVGQTGGN